MVSNDDIHNELVAIHARLGVIDGKESLHVRANRGPILDALEELIRKKPLVGQIYLVLDGTGTQREVVTSLAEHGIKAHESTISRNLGEAVDNGIAELRDDAEQRGKIYRRETNIESILNLSKNIGEWLKEEGETVPETKKPKKRTT